MLRHDDLEHYEPQGTELLAIDGNQLRIFTSDELPPLGATIAIHRPDAPDLHAVVTARLGHREVKAWMPAPPADLRPGLPARVHPDKAGFPLPQDGHFQIHAGLLRPSQPGDLPALPQPPQMTDLKGSLRPLPLGIRSLDLLTPICVDGLNLLIDESPADKPRASHRLVHSIATALQPDLVFSLSTTPFPVDHATTWHLPPGDSLSSHLDALQITTSLGEALRAHPTTLAIIDLPSPTPFTTTNQRPDQVQAGLASIVDLLGRHLVATKKSSLTVVLRLLLHDHHRDLGEIIDTLHLGDVDTQIFIDPQSRYLPTRSLSRAHLDETAEQNRQELFHLLAAADRAEEKAAIFGTDDLTAAEQRALSARADLYEVL